MPNYQCDKCDKCDKCDNIFFIYNWGLIAYKLFEFINILYYYYIKYVMFS